MSERILIGVRDHAGQRISAPVVAFDYYGKHAVRWVKRDNKFVLEHRIGGPDVYEWVEVPFIKEPEGDARA